MEYTVKALSELSGVTPRTLRWYDKLELLKPGRTTEAGYRLYGAPEVDRLQQILFYRELGFGLEEIKGILDATDFNRQAALQSHLSELKAQRKRLEGLILTVEQTIRESKGECTMTDREKFEAFKREIVKKNEETHGKEAREKYGQEAVDASNKAMLNMTQEEYERFHALEQEIREGLESAVQTGEDPAGPEGQRLAELHGKWLAFTVNPYNPKRHEGIAELYVLDERFASYYDAQVPGCARFLRDAVKAYVALKKNGQ